jgi:hypothetical protein
MDRYFYSVEMDGDRRVVHMSGNVYFNDADETETCYRIAEWTFFYMTIDEIQKLFEELRFYDYINERVDYMGDRTEDEALAICQEYFNGTPGKMLHITQVNEDTPCGDYWFE